MNLWIHFKTDIFFSCSEEIKELISPKEACSVDTKLPSTRGM